MKRFFILIIFLTTLHADFAIAGAANDIINQQILRRDKIITEIVKANGGFKNYVEAAKLKTLDNQVVIQNIKDEHIKKSHTNTKAPIKPSPEAIIFVSFSMPTLSLKQIIHDAHRYQVPIIIRGLYKNSFRETIEKIFNLVKEDNKGGISINPVWFRKYDIKTVPALVVNNKNQEAKDFDIVYGNIRLKNALTIIANQGNAAKVAQDILTRGGK
jgi:type-F conjugative transfer system pilin assembly protein TrbC